MTRPTRPLLTLIPTLLLLAACGGGAAPEDTATANAEQPLLLVPQDVVVAEERAFGQGPVISGSLQPEQRAQLRAEVSDHKRAGSLAAGQISDTNAAPPTMSSFRLPIRSPNVPIVTRKPAIMKP